MARDKALIRIDGKTMAIRASTALHLAGAARVTCIGGDLEGLRTEGLVAVPDDEPGAGPLGGVLTALRHATEPLIAILAVDHRAPDPVVVRRLVERLDAGNYDVVVPRVDGHPQVLHAVWRAGAVRPVAAVFARGGRAVRDAVGSLAVDWVDDVPLEAVTDADRPSDLPG